jgi:hypothetical protein
LVDFDDFNKLLLLELEVELWILV